MAEATFALYGMLAIIGGWNLTMLTARLARKHPLGWVVHLAAAVPVVLTVLSVTRALLKVLLERL